MQVSAVIPTRGDVDTDPIREHLQSFPEIDDIWIVQGDTVFNRYRAAQLSAVHDVIYTQDDDCITDLRPILEAYEPGIIVNAMTPDHQAKYPGRQTLVGFGAIFDRSLTGVLDGWEQDELFLRECDRVFTALNEHKTVFPRIENLPHATSENRMYREPGHFGARAAITRRIFERTGIAG